MRQDEILYRKLPFLIWNGSDLNKIRLHKIGIADKVKNFAIIYLCDIDEVPNFNKMYELYVT